MNREPTPNCGFRRDFRRPRIMIPPAAEGGGGLLLWSDCYGDRVLPRAAEVRLDWDDEALTLEAVCGNPPAPLLADLPPEHPKFWTQEHIELRLLLDPAQENEQVQFILAPDGRCFDNQGWNDPALATGEVGDGWRAGLRVPWSRLGITPRAGLELLGLVAHTRWFGDGPTIHCCTAACMGFNHSERMAVLTLAPPRNVAALALLLDEKTLRHGGNPARLMLKANSAEPVAGRLLIETDRGQASDIPAEAHDVTVLPEGIAVPLPLELERASFRRITFSFHADGGRQELGAVTLRAAANPRIAVATAKPHPRFGLCGEEIERLRGRLTSPRLRRILAGDRDKAGKAAAKNELPAPGETLSMAFKPGDMNLFRVCRESLLRDGKGGKRAASARIWSLLPPAAQQAAERVVAEVEPTEAVAQAVIDGFNTLLRSRELYEREAFAGVLLPVEGRQMLNACAEAGVAAMDEATLMRFNRILLQSAIECIQAFRVKWAGSVGACFRQWLVTGEAEWIERATRYAAAAAEHMILEAHFHLQDGNATGPLALAYDTLHGRLDSAQRGHFERLLGKMLDSYLGSARERSWTTTTLANAAVITNANAGLAALALMGKHAQAEEALEHALRLLTNALDYCYADDGGNTEGAQYWQYASNSLLFFGWGLERATGSDEGILSLPAVKKAMNMIRVGLAGDGALSGINDTIPMLIGTEVALFLAARENDEFARRYADHALRWFEREAATGRKLAYGPSLFALIVAGDYPEAEEAPPLPEAFHLASVENAVLRSAPRWDADWVVFVKGARGPYTHHNQSDVGAVSLDLHGRRMLLDPGYYKGRATDHTLPLIGETGPATPVAWDWTGRIERCEVAGGARVCAIDTTKAYRYAARKVRRVVVLLEDACVLLEDIDCDEPVTLQYQCGGETAEAGETAFLIRDPQATMRIDVLGPACEIEQKEERSLLDTHWGYAFADCRLFPVHAKYEPDPQTPLISVCRDATAAEPPATLSRAGRTITVALGDAGRVTFAHEARGWRLLAGE